jgi:CRP-like cAMP-binding protein
MKFLRAYIEEKIEINDDEWERVVSLFTKKVYAKGTEIFSAGEIHENIYYVSEGIFRMYMIDTEGKDITWGLNYHQKDEVLDPFSADYVSYLTQSESDIFCEALCDCVVYTVKFNELDRLYESGLKWMKLGKIISDSQIVTLIERTKMMSRLTAKEKYLLMKNVAPMYERILPDYQYATVLCITPQSLSRIKRGI